MRALSVKQPNAEKILRGTKVVEYRDRPTKIRERVYLYASKTPGARADFEEMGAQPGDFPVGVLVGSVEIVDCAGGGRNYRWYLAGAERLAVPLKPLNRPLPTWFYPFDA